MAVHETKRRGLVEEKLNSYVEECAYLRRTLGAAMGAASRDELLADVEKIRDAEQAASQQLLRAPPGSSYPPPSPLPPHPSPSHTTTPRPPPHPPHPPSSLDAIIEEDSFEPSLLLSPKGEGQPRESNGSHALNGSIEDGIEL